MVNHPELFVYRDLLGHCKNYFQHKLLKLFHYILSSDIRGFGHRFENVIAFMAT